MFSRISFNALAIILNIFIDTKANKQTIKVFVAIVSRTVIIWTKTAEDTVKMIPTKLKLL